MGEKWLDESERSVFSDEVPEIPDGRVLNLTADNVYWLGFTEVRLADAYTCFGVAGSLKLCGGCLQDFLICVLPVEERAIPFENCPETFCLERV